MPRLLGGASAATVLLGAEADGLSIDFTDESLVVRDTTTTSNAYNGNAQTFWRDRSFTSYASPSPKITRDSSGLYTFRPHNLLVMSEKFTSAAWTATSLTVTDNTVANPLDGATTAATLALVDASATHQHAATAIAFVTTHRYTFSVYAKANTHGFLQLAFPTGSSTFSANSYANFNLSTGATSAGADATATATDVGSGWYRCSITSTATASATTAPLIVLVSAIGAARAETHDPNSTNSVYAYGAMVNHGPTALTYTKTQAHNLILQSQTFANGSWNEGGIAVISEGSTVAPDGTATADTLTASGPAVGEAFVYQLVTTVAGTAYTTSVYAKKNNHRYVFVNVSGDAEDHITAVFDLDGGGTAATETDTGTDSGTITGTAMTAVGNGWYRLSLTGSIAITATVRMLGFAGAATGNTFNNEGRPTVSWAGTESFYVWGAQIELASSAGKYVATTAAAVYESRYELPREWDSAGACQGLLVEEARTNLGLYSNDLTNAAWTKSNMTTALTATGPDGVSNTATTCTATAGNATALQAITSGNAARITSMFVKRRTGTGNIDLTQDNGSTWSTKTVTSSWTRVEIASVTSTNPTVGIRIVTSGDAVDIALFQHEIGAFITSPIYTGSASVTRAGDLGVRAATSLMAYSQSAVTLYAKGTPQNLDASATVQALLGTDDATSNERHLLYRASANPQSITVDGGVTQADVDGGSWGVATSRKVAASIAANDVAISFNGGAAVTDATATMPAVHTIGIGNTNSLTPFNGHIAQIMVLPRAMSDAELVAVTT
jgi:hypothetical protein